MYRARTFILLLLMMQALFAQTRGPLPVIPDVDSSLSPSQGYVEVSFGSLYYEVLGHGDTVILIHGHPFNRRVWDAQFNELAQNYRVVRYDLRGYGASTAQIEHIQFTHADDLSCLMHALDINKAHLVGFALGGNIVADMLALYPERVSSAVMVNGNTTLTKGPSEPMDAEESARRDEEIALVSEADSEKLKATYLDKLLLETGTPPDTVRQKLQEMINAWDAWQLYHKEARLTGGIDTYNLLKENPGDTPVLIIETKPGNPDTKKPPGSLFPNRQYKFIHIDSGYFVHLHRPQILSNILLDFWR